MPTYDYVCSACHHAFERFQEMSARKLRTCPRCKKPALERQVGAGAGLIFKGSGFYITDYKRSGASDAGEKGAAGETSGSGDGACRPPPGGCGQPACPGATDGASSSGGGQAGKSASPPAAAPSTRASKKG